ncbi:MAG: M23 family metallopeptidase, partial [Hyphomicrobiaceae bacterium]|nr:M23 family metallopeptidase [Hyphomicrobiaceae bacterium]
VDWAGPRGTPILAAGNGIIEEARRRGAYGNYIRIEHANGYDTTYSHMHKFGQGMRKGVKVKQGQIIGYIGSTGLSSGPHLHYEVLVNKRFVDPLKIKVPRARRLLKEDLADYQRERIRIIALLKRPPTKTNIN